MLLVLAFLSVTLFALPVQAADCTTDDAKVEATLVFIEKYYPPASSMIDAPDRDTGLVNVWFYPEERECKGAVRVTDDCRVTDAEGGPLNTAGARERTFGCAD